MYTYGAVDGIPPGVEVVSADEIIPRDKIVLHRKTSSPAFFSDRFRMSILSQGLGLWTDADVLYLKAVDTHTPNVFAWENHELVGTSVLGIDRSAHGFAELVQHVHDPQFVPPWYSRGARMWYQFRKGIGMPHDTSRLSFGVIGPDLVHWWVHDRKLESEVLPRTVFYPVKYANKTDVFYANKRHAVEGSLTKETIGIHLWHQGLVGGIAVPIASRKPIPVVECGSFIHEVARQLSHANLFQVMDDSRTLTMDS